MRFGLLHISTKVLSDSHTLQGKSYRNRFEVRYINSRKEVALTGVNYYEFIAIIENIRVKVVIKQIKNEEKIFLSVIPLFKQKMSPVESDTL